MECLLLWTVWDLLLLAWSCLCHAGQHVGGSDAIKVKQEAVGNSLTLGVDACSHGSCFLRKGALVPGLEVLYELTAGLKMPANEKVSQTTRLPQI